MHKNDNKSLWLAICITVKPKFRSIRYLKLRLDFLNQKRYHCAEYAFWTIKPIAVLPTYLQFLLIVNFGKTY